MAPLEDQLRPIIWHPDLNGNNILTDAREKVDDNIHAIIDWQHTCVIPALICSPMPPALVYSGSRIAISEEDDVLPSLPENYKSLPPDEKLQVWHLAHLQRSYPISSIKLLIRAAIYAVHHRFHPTLLNALASQSWDGSFLELRALVARLQLE